MKPDNWHTVTFGRTVLGYVHAEGKTHVFDAIGKPTGIVLGGKLGPAEVRAAMEERRKK